MKASLSDPRWQLAVLGAILAALTIAGAVSHLPGQLVDWPRPRAALFLCLEAASVATYFAVVARALRRRGAAKALAVILIVGAVMRIAALSAPPFLSTDIYRYVWDGRVQIAGINPYRYIPADPTLEPLRDATIYPLINRKGYAHTIYPPTAQIAFLVLAEISQTPLAIKIAMVLCEIAAIAIVLRLLGEARIDRTRIVIYAWNPVAVWEYAGNGHIDCLALGLIALALLAFRRQRDVLVGVALGAATLVKFLPGAIIPALWRRGDWRMPAALATTIVALYLCYISVGAQILGYLPGYAMQEGIATGHGIYWLKLVQFVAPLPSAAGAAWLAASALVLIALAVRVVERSTLAASVVTAATGAAVLATALLALVTPHYPWYLAWLALLACFFPAPSIIYLSAAAFILHIGKIGWTILYIPFAMLAVRDWLRTRNTRRDENCA